METEFHWQDGWTFTRKDDGIHIRNRICCVHVTIPYREWLSILKATTSMGDAIRGALAKSE